MVELDELYAELGPDEQRAGRLAARRRRTIGSDHRAPGGPGAGSGKPAETIRLLRETAWPREHQRYVRTRTVEEGASRAGRAGSTPSPDFLNEDNLARFGAYWSAMS